MSSITVLIARIGLKAVTATQLRLRWLCCCVVGGGEGGVGDQDETRSSKSISRDLGHSRDSFTLLHIGTSPDD